jgi:hypothetical protein
MLGGSSKGSQRRRDAARLTLGLIRFVNGGAALLAPAAVAQRLGVDPPASDPTLYPWRLFGVRTAIIGAHLWTADGDERRRALLAAVVIHASDTVAALTAAARGELPPRRALATAALSATNTGLAVLAQR